MGDCVGPLGLAGGQVLDLKSENDPNAGMETLTWIHTHKTAALLKAAVACGAILAGATDEVGKTAGKDEATDKTTYPKLLGLERSKEVAQELVDEAKAALSEFGDRAAPLLGLADYIIARKN